MVYKEFNCQPEGVEVNNHVNETWKKATLAIRSIE